MTQNAPTERARTALQASGIDHSPLLSLEREDALFVLTDETLVYQDGGGTRRVTLRDLTRIHSDQAGLLRVETPAGTALTASLLGFDVGQVQHFFKEVRSATARAKDLPDSPTPTVGGAKTFGSMPAPRATRAAEPGSQFEPSGTQTPETDSASGNNAESLPPAQADAPASTGKDSENKVPDSRKNGGNTGNTVVIASTRAPDRTANHTAPDDTALEASKPGRGAGGVGVLAGRAVEAASGLFKGGASQTQSPSAEADTTGKDKSEAPVNSRTALLSRLAPRTVVKIPSEDDGTTPQPQPTRSVTDRPATDTTADHAGESGSGAPPITALSRVAAATALARQAGTVENLAGRLRILGAVLFVGALLLALFQFTGGQPLAGMWTLLSGGVGGVALLALGEMSALLSLLARAPGPVPEAVTGNENGHDD